MRLVVSRMILQIESSGLIAWGKRIAGSRGRDVASPQVVPRDRPEIIVSHHHHHHQWQQQHNHHINPTLAKAALHRQLPVLPVGLAWSSKPTSILMMGQNIRHETNHHIKSINKGRKDEKNDVEEKQSDGRDLCAAEDAAKRQPLLKMFLFQSLFTPIVSLSLVKHCCRSFYRITSPGQRPSGSSLQSTVYKPPEYFRLLECDFFKRQITSKS